MQWRRVKKSLFFSPCFSSPDAMLSQWSCCRQHLSVSSSLPKSSKPSAVLPGPHLTWHLKWFQVKSSDDFSYHFVPGKLKLIRSSACRFRSIAVLLISESVPNVISGLSDCLDITNCTETKKTKNLKNISNESEKKFDEERNLWLNLKQILIKLKVESNSENQRTCIINERK